MTEQEIRAAALLAAATLHATSYSGDKLSDTYNTVREFADYIRGEVQE